ncbi:hypothetical protein EUGRSUZ_G00796 [Eucalyptus grandis]|uniref:Uncharacterized protein n=2 Tax=Eucalyptus grandis TaxID=71139 RepID=A0ACC3K0V3_EUCGR|nr:hypothetical protein EUGRSUZ_G00796 [Eucalyptus grandis]
MKDREKEVQYSVIVISQLLKCPISGYFVGKLVPFCLINSEKLKTSKKEKKKKCPSCRIINEWQKKRVLLT